MTTKNRAVGWLNLPFHASFRESFADIAAARNVGCLAYVLMPDHVHMLLCGLVDESDQRLFVRALRRDLGQALAPVEWQKQPYDNVLREYDRSEGGLLTVANYITENPVRAGSANRAIDWPFRGAWLPGTGWMDPCSAEFGSAFWTKYNRLVEQG